MTSPTKTARSDSASRIIVAPPRAIFRAFMDREVVALWRRPAGFDVRFLNFEPRTGGGYRMICGPAGAVKAGEERGEGNAGVIRGRFVELVPDERIVEEIEFEEAPAELGGAMRMTTTLTPVTGGTKVTFVCEDVPAGITAEDHQRDMAAILKNLAVFIE